MLYTIISSIVFTFLMLIWNNKDYANAFVKFIFLILAAFGWMLVGGVIKQGF